MSHYLSDAEFSRLFRHKRKNHAQICVGLRLIAANVAKLFDFACEHDLEDAISTATLECIEAIGEFDSRKSPSAFNYFTTRCLFRLTDFVRREQRRRARFVSLEDVNVCRRA